ncbi:MAG: molecular chaperone DnaJ [Actinobacteria bacterium]|jgi:molecular chaperone DnaJ|nr:molecular chaperone DnaJ [Actinomycetota bacterium]NCW75494.1 molecular chaperone DnaJ [Actinomycetota bacterium]NCW94063.1 molecular chaperone DnaJ [Actinomycetota bacterium]NCW96322.1 molecular chaperone DnaJ [Actinomycetota bacterium]NCX00135.1 molecular chaperone DnaJ [Actinomycetota bacterium]
MADHYQTLGVDRGASADEIKRAYRKLAREMHPDVNPDPKVQDRFKEITAAYEVLSDPEKRSSYDRGGDGFSGFGGNGFGGFSDIMDAFFGGGGAPRGPRPRMRQGQDALIRVEIDLNQACFGISKTIGVETAVICDKCGGDGCGAGSSPRTCDICKGRGEVQQVTRSFIGQVMTSRPCGTCQGFGTVIPNPCRECAGDGRVRAKRNIDVKIPAGVETGNRIQLSGQGEVGAGGGPAGDLYVEIIVAEHDFLVRDGEDLHLQLNVSMTGAALGTEMKVETLDGEIEVEVKPGTQSGEMIPVKGKGMTRLRSGTRGDLYVHINVEIPTKLSKAEAELLKSFAQLRGEKMNGTQVRRNSDSSLFAKFKEAFRG